jgi:hypothetical protein
MEDNNSQFVRFSEALRARGIDLEPWKLQAFADAKERGATEAQIVHHGDEGISSFKARLSMKRTFQGTMLGAVIAPAVDWLKNARPSWRETAKRSPKTVGLGLLLGAGAGWAVGAWNNEATSKSLESHIAGLKHDTREMELAWTEALAGRRESSVHAGSNR